MRHFYYSDAPLVEIGESAPGAQRRWLTDGGMGADVSVMFVEVKPGGTTLRHQHHYEHTMFFLEGVGEVEDESGVSPVNPWEVLYIKPGELHQIRNTGRKTLRFLAIEPSDKGEKKA